MLGHMRTTVTLAEDVAVAIERLRQKRGIGFSEAVNELIRAGLTIEPSTTPFRQRTYAMGDKLDVTNIGEVLEIIEGPGHR